MRSFGYYLMPGRWLQSNNNYKVLLRNIIGFSTNYYLECTAKGRGKREDRSLIDGVSLGPRQLTMLSSLSHSQLPPDTTSGIIAIANLPKKPKNTE